MSKKEKGNGILIPILSVLDGLVLIGTAGIVAFGMATAQVEPESPTVKLADACRIISTIQRDANEAVLENIDVPSLEKTAPTEAPETVISENAENPQSQEPPKAQGDVTPSTPVETNTERKEGSAESSSSFPPTLPNSASTTARRSDVASSQKASVQVPSTPENSSGRTIYITPTGKRYHYNGNCNGGTYIESTLEEALSLGLTPCQKCVL